GLARGRAGVAHLPSGLGVEGRALEKHFHVLALGGVICRLSFLADGDDRRLRRELLVTRELRSWKVRRADPTRWQHAPRTLRLPRHPRPESFFIDLEPPLRRQLSREVDWKTKCVVQQEGVSP